MPSSRFCLVVGLAPGTGLAEAIRPEVNGVAQEFVAGPADMDLVDLAGLVGDGRGPGDSTAGLPGCRSGRDRRPRAASRRGANTFLAPGRLPNRSWSGCSPNSASICLR